MKKISKMEKKAIKVTGEVTGKDIIEYFRSMGIDTGCLVGSSVIGSYYGVESGKLLALSQSYIERKGFEVIELPKKEEKKPDYYLYDVYLGEEIVVRRLKAEKVKIEHDDRLYFYLEGKVVASFTSSFSYVRRENRKTYNADTSEKEKYFSKILSCALPILENDNRIESLKSLIKQQESWLNDNLLVTDYDLNLDSSYFDSNTALSFHTEDGCIKGKIVGYIRDNTPF